MEDYHSSGASGLTTALSTACSSTVWCLINSNIDTILNSKWFNQSMMIHPTINTIYMQKRKKRTCYVSLWGWFYVFNVWGSKKLEQLFSRKCQTGFTKIDDEYRRYEMKMKARWQHPKMIILMNCIEANNNKKIVQLVANGLTRSQIDQFKYLHLYLIMREVSYFFKSNSTSEKNLLLSSLTAATL